MTSKINYIQFIMLGGNKQEVIKTINECFCLKVEVTDLLIEVRAEDENLLKRQTRK